MVTRILAFSTTNKLCSVALMVDACVYKCNVVTISKRHSEQILCVIDQLLSEVGITLQSLDCLIFDKGPGNFIGVRVGISVAQGLALGIGLPVIEISSLAILAQGAKRLFGANKVITAIDACANKLYWAHYFKTVDNNWICNSETIVTEFFIKKLISSLCGEWVLVGTGWNKYSIIEYVIPNDPIILRSIMYPDAQDMLSIGIFKWINKLFIDPDQIKPNYLYDRVYDKKYECDK